jgi:hypothetical protein
MPRYKRTFGEMLRKDEPLLRQCNKLLSLTFRRRHRSRDFAFSLKPKARRMLK